MSEGFVVKTAAFLQEKLAFMGLTPREYNEFIVCWLPLMHQTSYNLITFQTMVYVDFRLIRSRRACCGFIWCLSHWRAIGW